MHISSCTRRSPNGTPAACAPAFVPVLDMAVFSRTHAIGLHADHILYCALMLIYLYVELFTLRIVI